MRVLSVIHYPIYGGPHNINASVIPLLARSGIETTVLLPEEAGNAYTLLRTQGISVIQMPLSRVRAVRDPLVHLRMVSRFRRDVRRLRALIRSLDVDAVLVNGLANPQSAVAAHLEGIPVVWQLLDTFSPMALRRAMMVLVTRLADAVMSTGRTVAELHPGATAFGERLVLFYTPVDAERFVNGCHIRAEARERLGLPSDCLVIGNVGNINLMKGHDVFVEAAIRTRRVRPNTRFVILGAQYPQHARYAEGLWRTAAEGGLEVGKDLIVVDPGTNVAGLAPAFDVFWLTSNPRSEGIPTVIGEAMALALPVVASRVGSVHEAVADGVTGRLVPPRDPGALLNATLPYLDDGDLRRAAGQAGREQAKALYSPEGCASSHVRALELAVEHSRRRRARAGSAARPDSERTAGPAITGFNHAQPSAGRIVRAQPTANEAPTSARSDSIE